MLPYSQRPGAFLDTMHKVTAFLKDVRAEMTKVSWPTKGQMVSYTLVVVGMSLAIAIYLGALDALFTYLVNTFLTR